MATLAKPPNLRSTIFDSLFNKFQAKFQAISHLLQANKNISIAFK